MFKLPFLTCMRWNNTNDRNSNIVDAPHADAINPKNIKKGKGTSTQHTKTIEFEHPVEDVKELKWSGRGQYLLREAQVDNGVEPGERSKEDECKVQQAFDLRVIEITNRVLENPIADATHGEFPIADEAVYTLVLQHVRNEPVEEFISHLQAIPKVSEELSIDGKLNKPTITDWERKLTTADKNAINACAIRVLYAVYRSGQAFPQGVWDATVASSETRLLTKKGYEDLAEGSLTGDMTREALRNWAREWLEACVSDECLFGRNQSQVKYPVTSIIGLLAHAALESCSLTGASETCNWVVDPELVPDRRTIMELINKLNVDEIAMLFGEFNHLFLQFADEYTILNEEVQLAFDPTNVENHGEDQDDHWVKGHAQILKGELNDIDADQKWEFGFAGVTENDVRFALGMYPINARSNNNEDLREKISTADVMRRLLPSTWPKTPVSPDLLVMDRGVKGADVIDKCRGAVGNKWISLWNPKNKDKDKDELQKFIDDTPLSESGFYKVKERFNDLTDKPNAIVVRAPYGATKSQWIFLTDLPREEFLKETEDGEKVIDRSMIISAYQNRCRIETTLGQIKHDFEIPVRDSTGVHVRYFCLNMAMVFYNLHNLISNSLSPKYGLPLGKTRGASNGEVLCAIREVAFEMAAEEQSE